MEKAQRNLEPTAAGAIVSAVVTLLPFVRVFVIPAYVVGPFVAIWYGATEGRQMLNCKQGAKIGSLSAFYGVVSARLIYDLIWQFAGFRLWQTQDSEMMVTLVRLFADQRTIDRTFAAVQLAADQPFVWYTFVISGHRCCCMLDRFRSTCRNAPHQICRQSAGIAKETVSN